MDNKLQIRFNIGDHLQSKIDAYDVTNNTTTFQLSKTGVNNLVSVKVNGVAILESDYVLTDNILSIESTLDEGDKIEVIYKYCCINDTYLDYLLASTGDVVSASISAISWLLADAARLYNYSTGDESMQQAEVFQHLKDIRSNLKGDQDTLGGADVPRIFKINGADDECRYRDISRWD